ncbi:hypothetical protein CEXT_490781 [Caerostris extrusa]|uniref:Uncharacterized protein n=1 Tax=Caerostris extrusa TaxID=172846 RepID=A0AAV4XKL8_CAEEX|nr:hypothetical protein CEXT_490781 [Caerostris extrusa]
MNRPLTDWPDPGCIGANSRICFLEPVLVYQFLFQGLSGGTERFHRICVGRKSSKEFVSTENRKRICVDRKSSKEFVSTENRVKNLYRQKIENLCRQKIV